MSTLEESIQMVKKESKEEPKGHPKKKLTLRRHHGSDKKGTPASKVPRTSSVPVSVPSSKSTSSSTEREEITCPLSGKIFVYPYVATDGKTYERAELVNYLKQNKNTTPGLTLMEPSEVVLENKKAKRDAKSYIKKHPGAIVDRYMVDFTYKTNRILVDHLVKEKMFEQLGNIVEFDLADMLANNLFKPVFDQNEGATGGIQKHVIDNAIDLDCEKLALASGGPKGPARNLIHFANNEVITHYLGRNVDSDVLKQNNYHLRCVLEKQNIELLTFICSNFEVDWNKPHRSSQSTPLMVLVRLYYNDAKHIEQHGSCPIPDGFVEMVLQTHGSTLDWNTRNKKGESALSVLFDDSTIMWGMTTEFIKQFDPKNPPNFMAQYMDTDMSILHRVCGNAKNMSKEFVKVLDELFHDQMDFNSPTMNFNKFGKSDAGSGANAIIERNTPFSNLCIEGKISVLEYVFETWTIERDVKTFPVLKERVDSDVDDSLHIAKNEGNHLMGNMLTTWFTDVQFRELDDGHVVVEFIHD